MDSNVVHRLVKEAPKLRNKLNLNKVEVMHHHPLPFYISPLFTTCLEHQRSSHQELSSMALLGPSCLFPRPQWRHQHPWIQED